LVQRLKATLRPYHRGALDFFTDWTSPAAWRFVKRFSNPESLVRARKQTLIAFLKANRIGLKPWWLERIEQRTHAGQWPVPGDHRALEVLALATVAQLQALQPYIDQCERLIAQGTAKLPHFALLASLPGAGKRLAPAITAITSLVADEGDRHQSLRCLSGIAPVEATSGKRRRVRIRRRCNKHWRDTLHLFAHCSTCSCAWARAFYDLHRASGDSHAGALRKLADKWLKIINRMLVTGEPYDDHRYVQSLRKNKSPVYLKLCDNSGG
jgi:transposase